MNLLLYNTLTRRKEPFQPLSDPVRIYACGMTVQDAPHLGHMRAYLTVDVLRRYIEYCGLKVYLVQNFTDVEDRIIARAQEEKVDYRVLTDRYIEEYFRVARLLNLKRADFYPRATQHIAEIVSLIRRLVEQGVAYRADGDVYYDVNRFAGYGKLSGKNLDDLRAGARVVPSEKKRSPLDFALWKSAKSGEPWWDSPWGQGRPGWHIECSAMAMHCLGETFDIHCGGEDLIFPHHENEIAQSEAATGKPFARFWLHNGLLNLTGEKMSKSTKHFRAAEEFLKEYSGNALRLFFLKAHYRSPLEYDPAEIEAAQAAFDRLDNFLTQAEARLDLGQLEGRVDTAAFEAALNDDLNTPRAIGLAFDLVSEGFASLEKNDSARLAAVYARLRFLLETLGFSLHREPTGPAIRDLVELLVRTRNALRAKGDFASADRLRQDLAALGVMLEDTPAGTRTRFARG